MWVLALGAWAGCGPAPGERAVAPAGPEVAAALREVVQIPLGSRHEAVGTVRARLSSTLQSKTMGQVTAVHVREGDQVRQGQLLLEIDSREAAAQVQRAASALKEAQAARHEVDSAVLAASHARSAADAGDDLAATTYERYKRLSKQGAVSKQAFDEADAKRRSASAQTAQASSMVASMQARRGEMDARIAQAEAELSTAETMLSHTRIEAPFDGQIMHKRIDVGDMATPGVSLLDIEAPDDFQLEAELDESLFGQITPDQEVSVLIDSLGDETLPGKVGEIVPSADAQSRTFLVKIDLGAVAGLRSGMFGRALISRVGKAALAVPESAVVTRGQLDLVFAVDDAGVARLRLVTVGRRQDGLVEVLSGLEAGERVVDAPGPEFRDGSRVVNEQGK